MSDFLQPFAGRRPGDPREPAGVIRGIAGAQDAPPRLPPGGDAFTVLHRAYAPGTEELDRWADLARSKDFDGLAVSHVDHTVLRLNSP
jgi:hypothetical protein